MVKDEGEVLGRKTLLWRAEGYTRKTFTILAPKLFPQRSFYESLNFHQGRTVLQRTEEPDCGAKPRVIA